MKRELHHYQYACDGYASDGKKCQHFIVIIATDSYSADVTLMTEVDAHTGLRWFQTHVGWLCPKYVHRDDPRMRARVSPRFERI